MSFSENLHRFQIPEWTHRYINYTKLELLQKGCEPATAVAAFRAEFQRFENFDKCLVHGIRLRLDALYHYYGIDHETSFDGANNLEVVDIGAALEDVMMMNERLSWYRFVNKHKILQNLTKLTELYHVENLHSNSMSNVAESQVRSRKCFTVARNHLLQLEKAGVCQQPGSASLWIGKHSLNVGQASCIKSALRAIDDNDGSSLVAALVKGNLQNDQEPSHVDLFWHLLYLSIVMESSDCLASLLDLDDIQCDSGIQLSWLLMKLGRLQNHEIMPYEPGQANKRRKRSVDSTKRQYDVLAIVDFFGPVHGSRLYQTDMLGRLPLHYAVQYRLLKVVPRILDYMLADNSGPHIHPAFITDVEGTSSLKLCIVTGDGTTTGILLKSLKNTETTSKECIRRFHAYALGDLLHLAIRLKSLTIVRLLLASEADVNLKSQNDETALHLAVRLERLSYVQAILKRHRQGQQIVLDAVESVSGWTPLILASRNGNKDIVELLLRHGADPMIKDAGGCIAREHAAYKGRVALLNALISAEPPSEIDRPGARPVHDARDQIKPCHNSLSKIHSNFSQIYICLGALDAHKPVSVIDLSTYVSPCPWTPAVEAGFSLELRALHSDQPSYTIQLPIMEDTANSPFQFSIHDPTRFQIAFDVYRLDHTTEARGPKLGSAIALLNSLKLDVGSHRESLTRHFTIPILQKNTLALMGTITFYLLLVTPFANGGKGTGITSPISLRNLEGPPVIGHRGSGQNDPSLKQLQLGENTIDSFLSAQTAGATSIEFDVQLTKDSVPIIYHGFFFSETGLDAPICTVNLEQFLHANTSQGGSVDLPSAAEHRYQQRAVNSEGFGGKKRSQSVNAYDETAVRTLMQRLKLTHEFQMMQQRGIDGYAGNVRGKYIRASLTTLEEVLTRIPKSLGFDIEIKYPMDFEARRLGMDTYAVEANHMVDTILDMVYRLAGSRAIFFSSFSPEICILLSRKQSRYPVYFLTRAGYLPSNDARAASLLGAVHFARSWNLRGIVCLSHPLVQCPHLIRYVKAVGLECISWGPFNDNPEFVRRQVEAGIDAVITNRVKLATQTIAKIMGSTNK